MKAYETINLTAKGKHIFDHTEYCNIIMVLCILLLTLSCKLRDKISQNNYNNRNLLMEPQYKKK